MKMETFKWTCMLIFVTYVQSSTNNSCCHLEGVIYDCQGCGLLEIPDSIPVVTKSLLLSNNQIKNIKPKVFCKFKNNLIQLYLDNNQIENLDVDSLACLSSLSTLDLSQNLLCRSYSQLSSETFTSLTSLKSLNMQSSESCEESYPDQAFAALKQLEYLYLPPTKSFTFNAGFEGMKKLKSLVIKCQHNSIGEAITDSTFKVFNDTWLTLLDIRNCDVSTISNKALQYFHYLESLNVACNDVGYKAWTSVIKRIPSKNMTTLVIDQVSLDSELNILSNKDFGENMKTLRRLSVKNNRLVSIDLGFINSFPSLEHIAFGYNSVLVAIGNQTAEIETVYKLNSMNFHTLDLSYYGLINGPDASAAICNTDHSTEDFFRKPPSSIQPPKKWNKHIVYINGSLEDNLRHNIPSSLFYIYLDQAEGLISDFSIKDINVDNNILMVNISGKKVGSLQGSFRTFTKLQMIDASHCGISKLDDDAFSESSIKYLNLSSNRLGNNPSNFSRSFKNMEALESLNLADNNLKSLDPRSFETLTELISLNLADNRLSELNLYMTNMISLKFVDLSKNNFIQLSPNLREALDMRQNHGNISIQLSANPFVCNCSTIDFIKWFQETNVSILAKEDLICQYNESQKAIATIDLHLLNKYCRSPSDNLKIIIPVSVIVPLAFIALIIVTYIFRWKLKWHIYIMKRNIRKKCPCFNNELYEPLLDVPKYDAFVSFNHEEEIDWVIDYLLPEMENKAGFRLLIGDRDFLAGVPISENIIECIDNSRKTIILLTRGFMTSAWCEFELHMALTKGHESLIICILEELHPEDYTKLTRKLVKFINCIEYNNDEDGRQYFWQRLRDALDKNNRS